MCAHRPDRVQSSRPIAPRGNLVACRDNHRPFQTSGVRPLSRQRRLNRGCPTRERARARFCIRFMGWPRMTSTSMTLCNSPTPMGTGRMRLWRFRTAPRPHCTGCRCLGDSSAKSCCTSAASTRVGRREAAESAGTAGRSDQSRATRGSCSHRAAQNCCRFASYRPSRLRQLWHGLSRVTISWRCWTPA